MKIMKIIKILGILFLIFVVYVLFQLYTYRKTQEENLSYVETCKKENQFLLNILDKETKNGELCGFKLNDPNCCYCRMRTLLLPRLLVYKVKYKNKPLKFVKPDEIPVLVPSVVLEEADAYFSYGVWKRLIFEENISDFYNKITYAYDCGIDKANTDNSKIIFESECIGTDKYVFHDQQSSNKLHSFGQKLKQLNLQDKKLYVRLDIVGAEPDVAPEILKYSDNIVGLTVHFDLIHSQEITREIEMLKLIEKNFVLVSRTNEINTPYIKNNCRYTDKRIIRTYILNYINKNMIDSKYLPFKQDYSDSKDYILLYPNTNGVLVKYKASWIVVLNEKLKIFYRKIKGIKE